MYVIIHEIVYSSVGEAGGAMSMVAFGCGGVVLLSLGLAPPHPVKKKRMVIMITVFIVLLLLFYY